MKDIKGLHNEKNKSIVEDKEEKNNEKAKQPQNSKFLFKGKILTKNQIAILEHISLSILDKKLDYIKKEYLGLTEDEAMNYAVIIAKQNTEPMRLTYKGSDMSLKELAETEQIDYNLLEMTYLSLAKRNAEVDVNNLLLNARIRQKEGSIDVHTEKIAIINELSLQVESLEKFNNDLELSIQEENKRTRKICKKCLSDYKKVKDNK